jgi:hypothetical protein
MKAQVLSNTRVAPLPVFALAGPDNSPNQHIRRRLALPVCSEHFRKLSAPTARP